MRDNKDFLENAETGPTPRAAFPHPERRPERKPERKIDEELQASRLFRREEKLATWLPLILFDGGQTLLPGDVQVTPIGRSNEFSGYEYSDGEDLYARIGIAPIQFGGFAVHKLIQLRGTRHETWEIYSEDGLLAATEVSLAASPLNLEQVHFEPRCPILNHLYNYLAFEYRQARTGVIRSRQVHFIELFLRRLQIGTNPLSARLYHRDPAIQGIFSKMTDLDQDPVMNWEERQTALRTLLEERRVIVQTKRRAHQTSARHFWPGIVLGDCLNFFHRLYLRPGSNLRGISYRYTFGLLFWFLRTVRGNIGYSIALAIYGPFTFYFITQPLNPHAMWAVGRVRSSYLDTLEKVKGLVAPLAVVPALSIPATPRPSIPSAIPPAFPPAAGPVSKAPDPATSLLGLPLSTLTPGVDTQPWTDRMSNFKAMQIGYEENLQFSARMGRLEQMETQLNFPLIVDSTWQEIDRYLAELALFRRAHPELRAYAEQEEAGSHRMQLYLWDRLLRFLLDHPYVVMDQSHEQQSRDYYFGHAFLLLRDLTMKLGRQHPDLKVPAEYKRVEKLAIAFQKSHVEGRDVLERVARNSRLFAQKDRFDGGELRSYMRRQWEILFLMQNKAQEAANFGLQMYTWSVRNTVWILQSLYSAKIRELALIAEHRNHDSARAEIRDSIEPLYESLFHLMNLEYASVKPEFSERLGNDLESRQRRIVIETTEQFLRERDKVIPALLK